MCQILVENRIQKEQSNDISNLVTLGSEVIGSPRWAPDAASAGGGSVGGTLFDVRRRQGIRARSRYSVVS